MAIGQPLRPTTRMLKYILAKMNSSKRMQYYYFVIDTKLVKLESTTDLKKSRPFRHLLLRSLSNVNTKKCKNHQSSIRIRTDDLYIMSLLA